MSVRHKLHQAQFEREAAFLELQEVETELEQQATALQRLHNALADVSDAEDAIATYRVKQMTGGADPDVEIPADMLARRARRSDYLASIQAAEAMIEATARKVKAQRSNHDSAVEAVNGLTNQIVRQQADETAAALDRVSDEYIGLSLLLHGYRAALDASAGGVFLSPAAHPVYAPARQLPRPIAVLEGNPGYQPQVQRMTTILRAWRKALETDATATCEIG